MLKCVGFGAGVEDGFEVVWDECTWGEIGLGMKMVWGENFWYAPNLSFLYTCCETAAHVLHNGCTPVAHLPHTFRTPAGHPPRSCWTPSRHLLNTCRTSAGHSAHPDPWNRGHLHTFAPGHQHTCLDALLAGKHKSLAHLDTCTPGALAPPGPPGPRGT